MARVQTFEVTPIKGKIIPKLYLSIMLLTRQGIFIVAPCILIFTQFIHQQMHIY